MPILTGTIFTRSPSMTNTTSIGFGAFLSALDVLVPATGVLVLVTRLLVSVRLNSGFASEELVPGGSASATALVSAFFFASVFFSLGSRVVTLAIGTVITF